MKNHRYLLILVAFVMLGAGCSSDSQSPLAPAVAVPMGGPGLEAQTRVIGPDGGCVVNGGVRLDIPAGALSAPTNIGIEWLGDGSVDLTPNGQQFQVPVSLTFNVAPGQDPLHHVVEWFDPAGGWVVIPSLASAGRRVAPLMHFSIYHIVAYE
jgi:hypothetical protein